MKYKKWRSPTWLIDLIRLCFFHPEMNAKLLSKALGCELEFAAKILTYVAFHMKDPKICKEEFNENIPSQQ